MAQDHAAKAVKGGDRACWGCGAGGDSVKPRTHRTGDSHPLIDVRQTSAFRPASRLRRGYSNHIHHCIVLSAPPPSLSPYIVSEYFTPECFVPGAQGKYQFDSRADIKTRYVSEILFSAPVSYRCVFFPKSSKENPNPLFFAPLQ